MLATSYNVEGWRAFVVTRSPRSERRCVGRIGIGIGVGIGIGIRTGRLELGALVGGEVEAEAARTLDSGRDYLELKKRLHDQTAAPPRATMQALDGALRSLGRLASKTRKEMFPPPGRGRPSIRGASFLVRAKRRTAWKKEAARIAAALAAQGHRLEMSGPWPPYHFVSK